MEREAFGAKEVRNSRRIELELLEFSYSGLITFFVLAATAQARTLETRFVRRASQFSLVRLFFCARRNIRELQDELPTETRPDGEAKTGARAST